MNDMIAVISAGGKGTRLSEITKTIPKPMVPVLGKPILEYQINELKHNGIREIYIIVNYLGDVIKNYFKDGAKFGVNIKYINETEPLGSGGALFYLKDIITSDFLFIYGDLIFSSQIEKAYKFHKENNSLVTLFTHPNSHPFDSDIIIEKNNCVVNWSLKSSDRINYYKNLVNSGIFIINNEIFDHSFKEFKKIDFEKDVIIPLLKTKRIFSYRTTEYIKDAGTSERLIQIKDDLSNDLPNLKRLSNKQKCIFLDRDGTINVYKGFLKKAEDFELEDGVVECIKYLNKIGYLVIIITNQPVIARGETTFEELDKIHHKLEMILGNNGCYIDDLFYCPHHPDSGFDGEIKSLKIKCDCRKPGIGLIKKAVEKYNIDLSKCYLVGDSTVDIKTGINAKVKTILVKSGLKGEDKKFDVKSDFTIDNLRDIINIVG